MLSVIEQLFSLLSEKRRKQFYILQFLVTLMAFTNLLGIVSMFTTWQLSQHGAKVGTKISDYLYVHYLQ